ncbi:MAG: ester cyclase [Roseobacter sp.]
MRTKAETIQKWYEDIWINGNLDRIDQIYRPAPEADSLIPGGLIDVVEARELVTVFNNLITDQKIRIVHCVENGDWASALIEMYGFKAGTDTPVNMRWLTMVRITNDVIVESYPSVDFLSLFEQLGQLPKDSFELLLSGTVFK